MPRSREREIKERIGVRVERRRKKRRRKKRDEKQSARVFLTHTLLVSSFWWFCWTNLIVGVQTAARGAVCVLQVTFEDI